MANEAAKSAAKVLAPVNIRDNFGMKSSQGVAAVRDDAQQSNPASRYVIPAR
jgi:hypothetical protein